MGLRAATGGLTDRRQPDPSPAASGAGSVVAVLAPVLLALGLYLWRIGTPALWLDEAATARESARAIPDLWAFLNRRDAGLGLYYLGMHVWTTVDDGEAWLRVPSALAMTAAVGLVADLARRWWGPASGLAAGSVMAVLPMTTRYAQEARPYALAIALSVASVWVLIRACRDGRRRWWAAYAVALALLGLTQLLGVLTVAAHPWLVAAHRGAARTVWRAWLGAAGCGLVAPAVLAAVVAGQRETVAWIPTPDLATVGEAFTAMAGTPSVLGVLVTFGALAVAAGLRPDRRLLVVGLVAWVLTPVFLLGALGLVTPAFLPRYLLVCAPGLVLLTASLVRGQAAFWRAGVLGLLVVVVAWPAHAPLRTVDAHGVDMRAAAAIVAAGCRPGDAVQETITTVHTLPYYLRDTACAPVWVSGGLPDGVRRVWVVAPTWQGSRPPGVTGLREVSTAEVAGARVQLWTR